MTDLEVVFGPDINKEADVYMRMRHMRRSSQSHRNPRGSAIVGKATIPGIPAEHDEIEDAVAFECNVKKLQEE